MLQALNRLSGTFVIKGLFAILLFAFIIFGIGDVFRGRALSSSGDVATVGKEHISQDQLTRAFQDQLATLERQMSGKVDPALAKRIGFLGHVLDAMIERTLMEEAAHDAGFLPGDKQLVEEVKKNPMFADPVTKAFSKAHFDQLLQYNHLTEADYVTLMRRELATELLANSELGPVRPPALLVGAEHAWHAETRKGKIVRLDKQAIAVPAPAADQLAAWYHAHAAQFMAPEYRDISFLYVDLASLSQAITVSPDEVKQAFEAKAADFQVPERRDLSQLVVPDEARAQKVMAAAHGNDLAAAAKAAGVTGEVTDLGLMAKKDMLEGLSDPVFAAPANSIVPPIKTPFGWAVIAVKKVEPGYSQSFEQAKPAIEADLKAEKARVKLGEIAKRVDDQLSGGATLAEAGKADALTPITVTGVDASGKHADGTTAPELKGRQAMLKAAFAADKGVPAQVEHDNDSAYALEVINLTPPALKPLDAVKAKVAEGYTAAQRDKLADAKAAALVQKAKSGTAFDAVAREADAVVVPIGPLLRSARDKAFPPGVTAALFHETQVGDVEQAGSPEGPILVRLTEIVKAPDATADEKKQIEAALARQLQTDFTSEYAKALRSLYPVHIDNDVLRRMSAGE